MYLVSIIIPVYNAEKYLEKTIQSIINQSIGFENIQLILVDDNSSDQSKEIIKKYDKTYENIHIFLSPKNHRYPGFGRNIGLKMAQSKYIMFLDNDDEYDINMCKILYTTIKQDNADIVCCNKITVKPDKMDKTTAKYIPTEEYKDKVIIQGDNLFKYEEQLIWNKIYKKEIIQKNNIKLLENNYADDFAFVIDYLLNSKKMIYLKNYYGYFWNIRSESLSHDVKVEYISELLFAYRYVCNNLKKMNKSHLINNVMTPHINHLILQITYLNLNFNEYLNVLKEVNKFENEINFSTKIKNRITNTINKLILKQHYKSAIYTIKIINKLRSII